ncbi:MAG TPA: LytTR family DNA-binding domain-containing protein [bacterium]|jgi:ABC-2 type transport system ATP-binding protein|nr:LytTR family DNA-binding domain-containing protein [bacterium]
MGSLQRPTTNDERRTSFRIGRIPVRLDGEIRLVPPRDILYCVADGGRVTLVMAAGQVRGAGRIGPLARQLEPLGFFRSHRAYLVNLEHVRSVIPWTRNAYSLSLEGNKEVPLSKHRLGALRQVLGW